MASEPAEPTTRQDPRTRDAVLARVIEEANEQVDDDWTTADTLAFREYFGERLATRLADLGLLADPAQNRAGVERDQRQARIDYAVAKLKAADNLIVDWQPSLEEWAKCVSLIVHVRAALVGDQPPDSTTLECPHCRSLIRAASGVITQLDVDTHLAVCGPARQFARECATAALSGVALRDVEDDAAGDLP